MSARILILDVLDPRGERGLVVDTQAAFDAGATEVVPLATGTWQGDTVLPADVKLLESALEEALAVPTQSMLVGALPNTKVAGAVVTALARDLPETLVFAPGEFIPSRAWFAGSAERQHRSHFQTLTREATVVVMTATESAAWLEKKDLDAEQAGTALCDSGAYAAWIRDEPGSVRSLDRLVANGRTSVLDYPAPAEDATDRAPGSLTALLGTGLTLQESVAGAQRRAACPTNSGGLAICR
ncbi:MAG: hypothetical protein GKS06_07270 [Acidobacteria bacterium]|nr:hypothetical protein [Acidobacteriota bacterium]